MVYYGHMDAETNTELKLIIARLWADIEEGFDEIPRELFWWNISRDPAEPDKERPSGGFRLPVPTKHRASWLKAMNILNRFDVFCFCLLTDDGQFIQYPSLKNLSIDELYYTITDFSMDKFLSFCDRFGFDLTQPMLKAHKAYLKIEVDNTPIIAVDNKKYYLPPLHDTTLVKMLKIALLPFLRETPLNKNSLNREGNNPDIVEQFLGGEKFHLGDNVNRLRKYRSEINFPEILDIFYLLTDTTVVGRREILITDEQLEEIQKLADYSKPLRA